MPQGVLRRKTRRSTPLAGGASAGGPSDRLSVNFTLPGQPAYNTKQSIAAQYGRGGSQVPTLVVLKVPAGSTVDSPPVLAALERSAAYLRQPPAAGATGAAPVRSARIVRVVSYADHRDAALLGHRQRHSSADQPRGVRVS